jgi:hypothetical protein
MAQRDASTTFHWVEWLRYQRGPSPAVSMDSVELWAVPW